MSWQGAILIRDQPAAYHDTRFQLHTLEHSLQDVETCLGQSRPELFEHPELRAALTHMLQSVDGKTVLLDFGTECDQELRLLREQLLDGGRLAAEVPFPPSNDHDFTFIDLFAGIGGFRIALQRLEGRCVFSSEWDKAAKQTYFRNFGEVPFGDIRQFTDSTVSDEALSVLIPDHDVLAAGFPCQPFSRAGVSARTSLGRGHGFACETQGTLFFDIVRIAEAKRPAVLILENVKNLGTHDGGRTFAVIRKTIEEELGYSFHSAVLDARSVVPQKRQRCFMVCFRDEVQGFRFPNLDGPAKPLSSILESAVDESYGISEALWQGHRRRTQRNIDRGAGFTAYEAKLDEPANTLVARYGKDGKECLVPRSGQTPRMLTPRECGRLQGFPEEFVLPDHRGPAYRQFGNSVPVPVVEAVAKEALGVLRTSRAHKKAV